MTLQLNSLTNPFAFTHGKLTHKMIKHIEKTECATVCKIYQIHVPRAVPIEILEQYHPTCFELQGNGDLLDIPMDYMCHGLLTAVLMPGYVMS